MGFLELEKGFNANFFIAFSEPFLEQKIVVNQNFVWFLDLLIDFHSQFEKFSCSKHVSSQVKCYPDIVQDSSLIFFFIEKWLPEEIFSILLVVFH